MALFLPRPHAAIMMAGTPGGYPLPGGRAVDPHPKAALARPSIATLGTPDTPPHDEDLEQRARMSRDAAGLTFANP